MKDAKPTLKEFIEHYEKQCNMLDACDFWATDDITPEIARFMVEKDGFCLRYIPNELITEELAMIAVRDSEKTDGSAICRVPDNMITYEMCLAAVQCETQTSHALEWIPDRFHTYELSMEAVAVRAEDFGTALPFVKDEFKTTEMCWIAYELDKTVGEFIPQRCMSKSLCKQMMKDSIDNFCYIPDKFKTREMCERAVKESGSYIEFVPLKFKTREMCERAVKESGKNLKFVPDRFIDSELYKLAEATTSG